MIRERSLSDDKILRLVNTNRRFQHGRMSLLFGLDLFCTRGTLTLTILVQ